MLLSDRRHSLLNLALAGMEIGWFVPFALLLISYWEGRLNLPLLASLDVPETAAALAGILAFPPVATFLFFFFTMLFYMLVADLLNQHQILGAGRALIIVALVLATSLLAVRALIYGSRPPSDFGWLGSTAGAVFNFTSGRRPETVILLLNAFLWFRVANHTERDLSFFGVGLSFRLGLLFAVAGGALLSGLAVQSSAGALVYFFFFTLFGLAAVALARMDEKALLVEGSRGSLLPWRQVFLTFGTALLTTAVGFGLGLFYTPGAVKTVLGWFQPLWSLLRLLLGGIVYVIVWLLAPLIERLYRFGLWLMSRIEPVQPEMQESPAPLEIDITPSTINDLLDRSPNVRYLLVFAVIGLILFLIWFFFLRAERRRLVGEEEEAEQTRVTYGGGMLGRGWNRLRNLMDLVRRYGLSTSLLAAISIQNIYANVSRIARARGHPRPPAQPPDLYLPALLQAFPDCEEELRQVTAAYMRVEYGDQALDNVEMDALRAAYSRIRTAPEPEEEEPEGIVRG